MTQTREEKAAYNKAWYARNRERARAISKAWYDRQGDKFHKRQREKGRKWRAHNREKCKGIYERAHQRKIAFLQEAKLVGCKRCGLNDVRCLLFHHRDPSQKKFTIGSGNGRGYKRLEEEVEKCDILCSNCHLILHSEVRNGFN